MIPDNDDVKMELHNNSRKCMMISETKQFLESNCDNKGYEKD